MAYEKQQWDTTSYINPTRMNHIEDGIKANSDAVDQNASDISLISSDLQGQIDEVNNNLIDYVIYGKATKENITVGGNNYLDVSFEINKDGYVPIGIIGFSTGNIDISIHDISISNGKGYITVKNTTSSAKSSKAMSITVLYIKVLK